MTNETKVCSFEIVAALHAFSRGVVFEEHDGFNRVQGNAVAASTALIR